MEWTKIEEGGTKPTEFEVVFVLESNGVVTCAWYDRDIGEWEAAGCVRAEFTKELNPTTLVAWAPIESPKPPDELMDSIRMDWIAHRGVRVCPRNTYEPGERAGEMVVLDGRNYVVGAGATAREAVDNAMAVEGSARA